MRTTRRIAGFVASVVVAGVLATGAGASSAEERAGFTDRDLRGTYSAFFEGELTQGPVTGHAVAVGLVRFDGNGRYDVSRTVHVSGPGGSLILEQTARCTYAVNPSGGVSAECLVSTPGQPDSGETFAGAITGRRELYFISTTPGLAAVGEARKQSRSGR